MYIYNDPARPTKVSKDELSAFLSPFLSMIGYNNLYDNIAHLTPNQNIYTINMTIRWPDSLKINMLFSPAPENTLLGVSTGSDDHTFLYDYINEEYLYYRNILPKTSGLKVIGISRVKNTTEKDLVIKIEVEQGPKPKSGGKKKRSRKKRKSTKQKRYIKKKRHTKKKYKTII